MADELQISPQGGAPQGDDQQGVNPQGDIQPEEAQQPAETTFDLGATEQPAEELPAPAEEAEPTEEDLPPIDPSVKEKVLNAEVPDGLIGAEVNGDSETAGAIPNLTPPTAEEVAEAPAVEAPAEPEPAAEEVAEAPAVEIPAEPEPAAEEVAEPAVEIPAEPEPAAEETMKVDLPEEPKEVQMAEPELPAESGEGNEPPAEAPEIAVAEDEPPKKKSKLPFIIAGIVAVAGIVGAAAYFGMGTQFQGQVTGTQSNCPDRQYHMAVNLTENLFTPIALANAGHSLNCVTINTNNCELLIALSEGPEQFHLNAWTQQWVDETISVNCYEYCPDGQAHFAPSLGANPLIDFIQIAKADAGHGLVCNDIFRECYWYENYLNDPYQYHLTQTTINQIREYQSDECTVRCPEDYYFDVDAHPGQSPPDHENETYDGAPPECIPIPPDCDTLETLAANPDRYFIIDATIPHFNAWIEEACAPPELPPPVVR
ncbi:hypothetical protein ACFL2V_17325, partial [Pseudomonadota bacterium]